MAERIISKVPKRFSTFVTVCITIVLICGISAWVYVQKQNIDQKDKTLSQQKALDQYNQSQLNARNKADLRAKCLESTTPSLVAC